VSGPDQRLPRTGLDAMAEDFERLVEDAARGNRGAVASLLEAYLPGLRAFVRLRMGNVVRQKESCSDIVQSACREVLENLERFKYPGPTAFKQWLYKTAARKIGHRQEYWLADKRDAGREVEPVPSAGEATGPRSDARLLDLYGSFCTPSRNAVTREELERIEEAFDQLSEDHRGVILMARILGMSRAEIAAEMGRSEAAVGNLLFRALAQFAELLDEGGAAAG
jgi:RNA polymerase sigma-70 factor (ECF subfamily)